MLISERLEVAIHRNPRRRRCEADFTSLPPRFLIAVTRWRQGRIKLSETGVGAEMRVCFAVDRETFKARCCLSASIGLLLIIAPSARAADGRIDYLTQIRPILRERCIA